MGYCSYIMSLLLCASLAAVAQAVEQEAPRGAPVRFQLPTDGPLPRTYRVTLAAVDKDDPDWVFGSVVAGEPYTVTEDNQGRFTAYWNGLDDNYMPMPPGEYGVKGIYMPAEKWELTGEYQTLIPDYRLGISSWLPDKDNDMKPFPVRGHGMWQYNDIHATPDGRATLLHTYIENGKSPIIFDLKKPVGNAQVLRSFAFSGGGLQVATDGEEVWIDKFRLYRASRRPFGDSSRLEPKGSVRDMDTLRHGDQTLLYTVQRFEMKQVNRHWWTEADVPVNKLVVYEGHTGKVAAEVPVAYPRSLSVVPERDAVYVLHQPDGVDAPFVVSRAPIGDDGLPRAAWQRVATLGVSGHPDAAPKEIAVDHLGMIFAIYPELNQVVAYSPDGTELRRFGRAAEQTPGAYDPEVFMHPYSITRWRTPAGETRVLVLEWGGPNRLSEWTVAGERVRHWIPEQISAVGGGVAYDPANPRHIYTLGSNPAMGGVSRFVVDYETGEWELDAVWPGIALRNHFPGGGGRPWIYNLNGHKYLVFAARSNWGMFIYRMQDGRWVPSAGLAPNLEATGRGLSKLYQGWWWHDANGDGEAQESEYRDNPVKIPEGLEFKWHGQNFLPDLSLLMYERGATLTHAWRLKPRGFDEHGNPIYHGDDWDPFLTDAIQVRKREGTTVAGYGANELGPTGAGGSSWDFLTGNDEIGYWWKQATGDYSANVHNQIKINRFVPDGEGGFKHVSRFGRGTVHVGPEYAMPDAMMGAMHINRPVHGLIGVLDASIATYWVYTEDGLYVDRLFPNVGWGGHREAQGMYAQPGEHFHNGDHFLDPESGEVIVSIGKITPQFFAVPNWKPDTVRRLTGLDARITLKSKHIATPPEGAIVLRGGVGKARLARVYPALGGVALDGGEAGWADATPIELQGNKQSAGIQLKYAPDHLYVRIHARLGREPATPALEPADRLFTHDRGSDTVSFYFQGDPDAPAPRSRDGRPGDVRIVLGLFDDKGKTRPVALAMYPEYNGSDANPVTYASPVGKVRFEHVGLLDGIEISHRIDEDAKGYVIAAKLPRRVLPRMADRPFDGQFKTMVNFDATFGHNKFWWANASGTASTETYDEPSEAALYPASWSPAQWVAVPQGVRRVNAWLIAGPFHGTPAEDREGNKRSHAELVRAMEQMTYPPDAVPVDYEATFKRENLFGKAPTHWRVWRVPDAKHEIALVWGMRLVYGSCWVWVPRDVRVPAMFHQSKGSHNRLRLNGEPVEIAARVGKADQGNVTLDLRRGWNHVWYRGFSDDGKLLRMGLDLYPPADLLWEMKITPFPQDTASTQRP